MELLLTDTEMAISIAIKAIDDTFNLKLKNKDFRFAGYTNNTDRVCTYSLLVVKYPLLIHISIDKKNLQFKYQIEIPKVEYLFNLIPQ